MINCSIVSADIQKVVFKGKDIVPLECIPKSLAERFSASDTLFLPVNQCIVTDDPSVTPDKLIRIRVKVAGGNKRNPIIRNITNNVDSGAEKDFETWAISEDDNFSIRTDGPEILKTMKDKIISGYIKTSSTLKVKPDGYDFSSAKLTKLEYIRTEWYLTENVITKDGGDSGSGLMRYDLAANAPGNDVQKLIFSIPTDPLDFIGLRAKVYFTWQIEIGGNSGSKIIFENLEDTQNAFIKFVILDRTPPINFGFSPNTLFGTTGDWIANGSQDFNFWRSTRGIGSVPPNEDDLFLIVSDNGSNSDLDWMQGVYHNEKNINALIYAETYISGFTDKKPSRQVSKIEETTKEYYKGNSEPPEGIGKFVWVGPINLREYYLQDMDKVGKQIDIEPPLEPYTDATGSMGTAGDGSRNVHIWKIPVKDLEMALYKKLLVQYKDQVDKTTRKTFLDHHFGSGSLFKFLNDSDAVNHGIENLQYSSVKTGNLPLGGFEILRLTASVSDSSGNWTYPGFIPKIKDLTPVDHILAYGYRTEDSKKFVPYFDATAEDRSDAPPLPHDFLMPIVVFDNDKPNPILIMTARGKNGTTRTTRFTIPNGDLAYPGKSSNSGAKKQGPYINDMQLWEFDYNGESDTMKWLQENDPARYDEYKEALVIQENARVVFEIVSYDNINKWWVSQNPFSYYGISTPVTFPEGSRDESMVRPITWTIIDPIVAKDETQRDLLFEDVKKKTYVYPDYIFRNVDENESYGVEVVVHDSSNFNEPSQNGGTTYNWRRLRLNFKILKDRSNWNDMEKMGNQENINRGN